MSIQNYLEHRLYGLQRKLTRLQEHFTGIDIITHHSLDELGLSATRSVWYCNSGNRHLRRVLDTLTIKPTDSLFDFGYGKGGVLFTAAKYPFAFLGGIELSPALAKIACSNATILGIKKELRLTLGDAATIEPEVLAQYSHFYFFNPFPSIVMREVLARLQESLSITPRTITLIYKNPVCHRDIMNTERFDLFSVHAADFGMFFHVYKSL